MIQRNLTELEAIRAGVARVARLSDGLIRLGPFGIGLDGVLAWVPGLGEIYSAAAGTYLLVQGLRAGVSLPSLALCAALLFGRTVITAVPFLGPAAADLLTAHRWSARLVLSGIDRRIARGETEARWSLRRRPAPVAAMA